MGLWKKYNGKGFFAEIAEKDKFGNDISESLSDKVDKVEGYGLSQENFTSAYKDKLDTITSGAEPNVQSDWEEVDSGSDSYIKNKPDPINLQAGENISIIESGSAIIISSQAAPQVNADWNSTSGLYPMHENEDYFGHENDRLHPNDKGQERMARTLMYQLLALPCQF
jgi:hypothetical protein